MLHFSSSLGSKILSSFFIVSPSFSFFFFSVLPLQSPWPESSLAHTPTQIPETPLGFFCSVLSFSALSGWSLLEYISDWFPLQKCRRRVKNCPSLAGALLVENESRGDVPAQDLSPGRCESPFEELEIAELGSAPREPVTSQQGGSATSQKNHPSLHYKTKTANIFQSVCTTLHEAVSFLWVMVMAVWMSKMSVL